MRKRLLTDLSLLMIITICVCTFSACAANSSSADSADMVEYTTRAVMATAAASYRSEETIDLKNVEMTDIGDYADSDGTVDLYEPQDERKMIRYADIYVETEGFESSVAAIQQKISDTGAYIESSESEGYSESYSRYCLMVVRVPADRFDEFMASKNEFGTVTGTNIRQEDVTLSYTDMEARLETLNAKKVRLLELMEDATEMVDIIELESALADTVAEIEAYTAQLNHLDNLIDYCTVTITINEVYRTSEVTQMPKTIWERIARRFDASISDLKVFGEELLVFLLGDAPILMIWFLVILAAILIITRIVRRHRLRKATARKAVTDMTEPSVKIKDDNTDSNQ